MAKPTMRGGDTCVRAPPLPGLCRGWGAGGPWAVERFLSGQEDDLRRFGAPRPAGERHSPTDRAWQARIYVSTLGNARLPVIRYVAVVGLLTFHFQISLSPGVPSPSFLASPFCEIPRTHGRGYLWVPPRERGSGN